ncbi:MAG: gliding motility-associated C-terminal domain-containing protein [Bacteroidales bacterium]|nr:gliding motility-associated C-terminal domain-containing protein [Bacteroidales bacterium]
MKMNIKDIMEQIQETPSPRCWESIASQLPAAGAGSGGSAAATAAKGAMSAGKLAAIIGSASAVVAIVTGTTIAILTHEPATESQPTSSNQTEISVSDSISSISADNTDIYVVENETENQTPIQNAPLSDKSHKEDEQPVVNASNSSNTADLASTPSHSVPTTPTTSSNTAVSPTPSSSPSSANNTQNTLTQNNTVNATPQTNQRNSKTEESTDNVTENTSETSINPDDFAYSRPVVIEIPNIFTPNGDGVNDLFVIKGLENCEKRMLIVKDQKGQTVFQSNRYDNNWDGANLPNGSYYYQFSYSINNINEMRKGVILIRR